MRRTCRRPDRDIGSGRAPATAADFLFLDHRSGSMSTSRSSPGRRGRWRWTPTIAASPRSTTDSASSSASCNVADVLDRTIVIVTADHGEEFGEHDLFDHGESLYRPEIRVPLLISVPPGLASGRVVDQRRQPAGHPGDDRRSRRLEDEAALPGTFARPPLAHAAIVRAGNRRRGRPGAIRTDGAEPERPQPRPIPRAARAADLARGRGLRLHPQRGGREGAIIQRARRPARADAIVPQEKQARAIVQRFRELASAWSVTAGSRARPKAASRSSRPMN